MSLRAQFGLMLVTCSLVSVVLFLFGAMRNHSLEFAYFVWNLFLAWLPLLFAVWLTAILKRKLWSSWEALGASCLWLLFLPNSFYMVSDYVHLDNGQRPDIVFDAVMFTSFIFVAFVIGIISTYLVHRELRRRFTARKSAALVGAVFLLCSFAIYLGRDLRWNSWDVLINPGGLLFDVSDRVLHPSAYPEMFIITLSFFALIASIYALIWKGARLIGQPH